MLADEKKLEDELKAKGMTFVDTDQSGFAKKAKEAVLAAAGRAEADDPEALRQLIERPAPRQTRISFRVCRGSIHKKSTKGRPNDGQTPETNRTVDQGRHVSRVRRHDRGSCRPGRCTHIHVITTDMDRRNVPRCAALHHGPWGRRIVLDRRSGQR